MTPGDWTGDGKPDLLARKANGELWLVAGNGKGGFGSGAADRHRLADVLPDGHPG